MRPSSRCPSRRTLSRAFADGAEPTLRRHLEACEACGGVWSELNRLRALAQQLPSGDLTPARRRAVRDAITTLAAASRPDRPASSRRWIYVGGAVAAVVLGVVLFATPWEASQESATAFAGAPYHASLVAHEGAQFHRVSTRPDEVVRLVSGTLTVSVSPLAPGERFRVITREGEVEVRGTAFDVSAERDQLVEVRVLQGQVVVRPARAAEAVVLEGGERWLAAPTASSRDEASRSEEVAFVSTGEAVADDPVSPPLVAEVAALSEEPASPPSAPAGRPGRRAEARGAEELAAAERTLSLPRNSEPNETELSYQTGFDALRTADFERAVAAFERVIGDTRSPLLPDAAYWRAVALGRAGRGDAALAAMDEYLAGFPEGSRGPEVQAMRGWILLDQGHWEAAEQAFEAATRSREARVRESAERGRQQLRLRRE